MLHILRSMGALLAAAQLFILAGSAQAVTLQDKTALQAAMQRHVDRQSVNGVFHLLDTDKGEVVGLHPVKAHPMILRMGENFVLCFDFRDAAGEKVEIDFYMTRKDDSFVVFHAAVSNHDLLHRLMNAGKVTRAN